MFQTTLSDPFLYDEVKEHGLVDWIAVIFWVAFTFLSAVIMMNQLIAMMGETYNKQQDKATVTWKIARAGIILESERSIMGNLVELWHRKKLRDVRPNHHVKGIEKLGRNNQMVQTYQIVVEERMNQTTVIQDTWAERSGDVTVPVAGDVTVPVAGDQGPHQVLSESPEIALLEVAQIMLEKKKAAAFVLGDHNKADQFMEQIDALKWSRSMHSKE